MTFKLRVLLVVVSFLLFGLKGYGQGGVWTWISGDTTANFYGNYGVKGVSSPNNLPGFSSNQVHWQDKEGNFWLFGGSNHYMQNALWKFNPKTAEWIWMHGPKHDTTQYNAGSYGLLGVSSPNNVPSSRSGCTTWVGPNGNLYLYGGSSFSLGIPYPNDLWMYNVKTNEWTWVWGNKTSLAKPYYGEKNKPSALNNPGLRFYSGRGWTYDNKLWLFGGVRLELDSSNTTVVAVLNDMWYFDLLSHKWAWVSGDTSFPYKSNFGVMNVPDLQNKPKGRYGYGRWQDSDSIFYIFSGVSSNNDLWTFDPKTYYWTWIGGDSVGSSSQNAGNGYCVEDSIMYPSARHPVSTFNSNSNCNHLIWVAGGAATGTNNQYSNDLWTFNTKNKKWKWVWGDTASIGSNYNYGSQGVASSSNIIPCLGATFHPLWTDNDNNLWVFAPNWSEPHSTMWKFTPDTNCVNFKDSVVSELATTYSVCSGDSLVLNLSSKSNVAYSPIGFGHYDSLFNQLYLYPNNNTTYDLSIKSFAGSSCYFNDSSQIRVVVNEKPIASAGLSFEEIDGINYLVGKNNSLNEDSVVWFLNGESYSNNEIQIQVRENTTSCVELVAYNSCATDTVLSCLEFGKDVIVPNAFTPNADGNNDVFKIINAKDIILKHMSIYNRFGQRVFYTNDKSIGWNGNLKGLEAPTETYFYLIIVQAKNGEKIFKGDLTLIR